MQKLRVGVLMGGKSIEKEVSFNSGRTICDHLDTHRYTIVPLFQTTSGLLYILPWRFLHRGKISDFEHRLPQEAELITWDSLKTAIDFVYIATHGRFAEDGTLQGMLETLGIPYLGSKVMASALSMDKGFQKKLLKAQGFDVPRGIMLLPSELESYCTSPEELFNLIKQADITFPCIIKPALEGSSLGITVVHSHDQLIPALTIATQVYQEKKQPVIVEEYLSGIEFTSIIITDYKTGKLLPLPLTEVVLEAGANFYDYEQKYMPGRATKYTPARINAEDTARIQDICIRAMKVLGITNLMRIDGFLTPDKRVVLFDPNTLSGMAPSSFLFRQGAEINMSHTQLINHLIETELHTYGMLEKVITISESLAPMPNQEKKRIGVLLGGRSNEKEISLESGRNIVYKLSPQKYIPVPLFVDSKLELYKLDHRALVKNSTKEIENSLDASSKIGWSDLSSLVDFVFIGLHGGEGENGVIQGTLEMLGLPYNGSSVLASSLCMDKYRTNNFLKSQGFEVPQNILLPQVEWDLNKQDALNKITAQLNFPVIVKPHDDGCSVLVSKANNTLELESALDQLYASSKYFAFIEEYIQGMELTVGVIGNETPHALPPSKAVADKGILSIEEKFLPGAGENQTPAPLVREALEFVKKTIEQVYKAIGCSGYARIDCFYQSAEQSPTKQQRLVIIEINSLPGMTPATCLFHQAAEVGIKPMDFIDLIIQLGFEKHASFNTLSIEQQLNLQA